jgi:hypothetical protein
MSMIQMLCRDEFVLRPVLLARLLQRLRAATSGRDRCDGSSKP